MLQKYKTKREEGFTIIEVLIVLAIAGLILLIVFLAVPALQRNARNNARNNEASRISSAVTDCLANRNGVADSCNDNIEQLGFTRNADGTIDGFQQFNDIVFDGTAGTEDQASVEFSQTCSPDGATTQGGTAREFTVTYEREPDVARCIGSESN